MLQVAPVSCPSNTQCKDQRTSHANTRQNKQGIKANTWQNKLRIDGSNEAGESLKSPCLLFDFSSHLPNKFEHSRKQWKSWQDQKLYVRQKESMYR